MTPFLKNLWLLPYQVCKCHLFFSISSKSKIEIESFFRFSILINSKVARWCQDFPEIWHHLSKSKYKIEVLISLIYPDTVTKYPPIGPFPSHLIDLVRHEKKLLVLINFTLTCMTSSPPSLVKLFWIFDLEIWNRRGHLQSTYEIRFWFWFRGWEKKNTCTLG